MATVNSQQLAGALVKTIKKQFDGKNHPIGEDTTLAIESLLDIFQKQFEIKFSELFNDPNLMKEKTENLNAFKTFLETSEGVTQQFSEVVRAASAQYFSEKDKSNNAIIIDLNAAVYNSIEKIRGTLNELATIKIKATATAPTQAPPPSPAKQQQQREIEELRRQRNEEARRQREEQERQREEKKQQSNPVSSELKALLEKQQQELTILENKHLQELGKHEEDFINLEHKIDPEDLKKSFASYVHNDKMAIENFNAALDKTLKNNSTLSQNFKETLKNHITESKAKGAINGFLTNQMQDIKQKKYLPSEGYREKKAEHEAEKNAVKRQHEEAQNRLQQ